MVCPAVLSGTSFIGSSLGYIDCQARSIGTFGFQVLSTPNSVGSAVLAGLMTLFVAIFGYRLVLGYPTGGRDVISAVVKIGIVLTLATSWTAFRTVIYDAVLFGPAEVAGQIRGASGLASGYTLTDRLQNVDNGIVALTAAGTGRQDQEEKPATFVNGVQTDAIDPNKEAFTAVAVDDKFGMGFARVTYLAGTLAPLGVLRIAAGLLLGLAPLFAGLLFFEGTRGIFIGWLRALATVALGSLAMIISLSVELALLEPWLADVLARREARLIAPAAPTELVVMALTFALVGLGLLMLCGRLAFNRTATATFFRERVESFRRGGGRPLPQSHSLSQPSPPSRAAQVAERLTTIYRGERRMGSDRSEIESFTPQGRATGRRPGVTNIRTDAPAAAQIPLGSSYRRTTRRTSEVTRLRDRRR